jgi:hydroxymethylglutaryl-CoA reductase
MLAHHIRAPLADLKRMLESGGLTPEAADNTIENAVGTYALPFGLALNFHINGVDRLVPMVVEEPSVIAATSNAARLVRMSGGFHSHMIGTWMTGQVELRAVGDAARSIDAIVHSKSKLLDMANAAAPGLVKRGGGAKDLHVRDLGEGLLVVHIYVDCQNAMGANLVNGIAESIGPELASIAQGRLGLRILTNLCDHRRVTASCRVAVSNLAGTKSSSDSTSVTDSTGWATASAIQEASRFAMLDPYRAATHNKGIMNGIDSVVLATGNDVRAVEAGAHAWAAHTGKYGPLAGWTLQNDALVGNLELPLALGIVGGTIPVHPTARWAIALLGVESASQLSEIAACVGLASNFSALRALATEGIQRGHMSLHARSVALSAGAAAHEVEIVARSLAISGNVSETTARSLLAELRREASEGKV